MSLRKLLAWMSLPAGALLVTGAVQAEPESMFDDAAAAAGRGVFRSYCSSCHGTSGTGDGSVAEWLKVKPADLTKLRWDNAGEFPLGEVMKIVDGRAKVRGHGGGEMPVWGDAFKVSSGGHNEEEVREMIRIVAHYIWSIQK